MLSQRTEMYDELYEEQPDELEEFEDLLEEFEAENALELRGLIRALETDVRHAEAGEEYWKNALRQAMTYLGPLVPRSLRDEWAVRLEADWGREDDAR